MKTNEIQPNDPRFSAKHGDRFVLIHGYEAEA